MLNSNLSGATVQDVLNAQDDPDLLHDVEDDSFHENKMAAASNNQLIHEEAANSQYERGSHVPFYYEPPVPAPPPPPPVRTPSYNTIYIYTTSKPVDTTAAAATQRSDHLGNYYSNGRYSQKDEYSILDPVYENPSFDVQDPR